MPGTDDRVSGISAKRGQAFKASMVTQCRLVCEAPTASRRELCLRHLEEHLAEWATEIRSEKDLQDEIRREWRNVFSKNKDVAASIIEVIMRLPLTDDCESQSADWMETVWEALPPSDAGDIPHLVECMVQMLRRSCSWADRIVDGTVARCRKWMSFDYEDSTIPHEAATAFLLALKQHTPWLFESTPELRQSTIMDMTYPLFSEDINVRKKGAECIVALVEVGVIDLSLSPLVAIVEAALQSGRASDVQMEVPSPSRLHGTLMLLAQLLRASNKQLMVWEESGVFKLLLHDLSETIALGDGDPLIVHAVIDFLASVPKMAPSYTQSCIEAIHSWLMASDEPSDIAAAFEGFLIMLSDSDAAVDGSPLLSEVAERVVSFVSSNNSQYTTTSGCVNLMLLLTDLVPRDFYISILEQSLGEMIRHIDPTTFFRPCPLLQVLRKLKATQLLSATQFPLQQAIAEYITLEGRDTSGDNAHYLVGAIESLKCFADLNQPNPNLIEFVEQYAATLLKHPAPTVRRVAVETLLDVAEYDISRGGSSRFASSVIEHMMQLLVADRDSKVRYAVISNLSTRFDHLLRLGDCIEALSRATHDPDQSVARAVLLLLCRLSTLNNAAVNPTLARSQTTALKDVSVGLSIRSRLIACNVLETMLSVGCCTIPPVEAQRSLLQSYPTVQSLAVQASILGLLAGFLDVSSAHQKHIDEQQLVPLIERAITDPAYMPKQLAALKLLRSLIRILTVLPATFMLDGAIYTSLRALALSSDRTLEPLRKSALHTLGVLGAADTSLYHRQKTQLASANIVSAQPGVSAAQEHLRQLQPPFRVRPRLASLFPSTALHALLRHVLYQYGSVTEQLTALRCAQEVLQHCPTEHAAALAEKLMTLFLLWLKDADRSHLHGSLLRILQEVCPALQHNQSLATRFGSELLSTLSELRSTLPNSSASLNYNFVVLLQQLAVALPEQIRAHTWTVSFLVERLSLNQDPLFLRTTLAALTSLFQSLTLDRDYLGVIPLVLDCIASGDSWDSKEVINLCLRFLNDMLSQRAMRTNCGLIVHRLMEVVELTPDIAVVHSIYSFLCGLLIATGRSTGQYFIGPLEALSKSKKLQHDSFQQLLTKFKAFGDFPEPGFKIPVSATGALPTVPVGTVYRITTSNHPPMTRYRLLTIIVEHWKISRSDVSVTGPILDITTPAASGPVSMSFDVSFAADDNFEYNMLTLLRRATDDPDFRALAGIRSVNPVSVEPADNSAKKLLTAFQLPVRRRELDWVKWLNTLEQQLVARSSHPALRAMTRLHDATTERSIFPFALNAFFSEVDDSIRASVMEKLSSAIQQTTSHDVRTTLFALAEFMESERNVDVPDAKEVTVKLEITVTRETANDRFGINYERDSRGVVVKKITPGLPGDVAKVPVGALLLRINNVAVHSTDDVRELIQGKCTAVLLLEHVTMQRAPAKVRPFFDVRILAHVARRFLLHEKAIHYTELLFEDVMRSHTTAIAGGEKPKTDELLQVTNALIDLCHTMEKTREATGVLRYIDQKLSRDSTKPEKLGFDEIHTLEKLNWWSRAKDLYEQRLAIPDSPSEQRLRDTLGLVRCLKAMGNHPAIVQFTRNSWELFSEERRNDLAPHCAEAAFALGQWELLGDLIPLVTEHHTVDQLATPLPLAAYYIFSGQKEEAIGVLEEFRSQTEQMLIASAGDSAVGAHDLLVQLQHVTHMEEVLNYQQQSEEQQRVTYRLWQRRMKQMAPQPQHLLTSAAINLLVMSPKDDMEGQLRLASVCRQYGWAPLAVHCTLQLLNESSLAAATLDSTVSPMLAAEYCKQLWQSGLRPEAYTKLEEFVRTSPENPKSMGHDLAEAWGRCWMMLGDFTTSLSGITDDALQRLRKATELIPDNCEAWHAYGMMQYVSGYRLRRDPRIKKKCFVIAIEALFRAVQLSDEVLGIQDTLRIVQLWFTYGNTPQVRDAVAKGISQTPLSMWLRVIPQLVARLGMQDETVRTQLEGLLSSVGKEYPHFLIGPLIVCEEDDSERYKSAQRVLKSIRSANPNLVDDYTLIRSELIRMAIVWSERWVEAILQASKTKHNPDAILQTLQPLFTELNAPSTPLEKAFDTMYTQSLKRARNSLASGQLSQAWSTLNQVYSQMDRANKAQRSLHLDEVAPALHVVSNSTVPVPGREPVLIASFHRSIAIIPSKQKPRRFGMVGNDGIVYRFLLKGREDLRQDERAMQLFGLINTVLTDPVSAVEVLSIHTYVVTPLSSNVGLVGWIERADTIFKMIEARRSLYGVSIYRECEMIISKGGLRDINAYHQCSLDVRKKLLQHVARHTSTNELRTIFWDNNDSCKSYLEYRKHYTHSMATMSMVGYIIGLGDRHLNNLMIVNTGMVAHIDFGDCFEVAQQRAYYPEAVPFRLTRLLVAAMGVTEVEGAFRSISTHVLSLLRKYKESLLSVLETFVYDPLIVWRFSATDKQAIPQPAKGEEPAAAATQPAVAAPAETDVLPAAADTHKDPLALSFSIGVKSVAPHPGSVSAVSTSMQPTGEWKRLADYLSSEAGNIPAEKDMAFPEHITPAIAVDHIRTAAQRGELPKAIAWWRYARNLFPETVMFNLNTTPIAEKGEKDAELFGLQSFCLRESMNAQQNDTAKVALRRVQSKLAGTEFTDSIPSVGTTEGGIELFGTSSSAIDSSQQIIFFGTTPHASNVASFAAPSAAGAAAGGGGGGDAEATGSIDVPTQVDRLIEEARSWDNLAKAFVTGWAPFW